MPTTSKDRLQWSTEPERRSYLSQKQKKNKFRLSLCIMYGKRDLHKFG